MNKEKWIEEVLQSHKSMQPAAPHPWLETKIEAGLQEQKTSAVPLRWVYIAALGFLFLCALNIALWQSAAQKRGNSSRQQFLQEYSFSNNDYYSLSYSK